MRYSLLTVFAVTLLFSGCGSTKSPRAKATGNAGETTPATPTPTHGNASFYGFMAGMGSPEMADWAASGSETFIFPNTALIDIWDPNQNLGDYLVYQPTCLASSEAENYSMVLVNGWGPNTISISRSSSGLNLQFYWMKDGIGRVYDTTETPFTATCASGRVETDGGAGPTLYANGKVAVLNYSGDIYFGVRDTALKTNGALNLAGTSFTWVLRDAEKWDDGLLWAATAGQINTSAAIAAGVADIAGISSTIKYVPDVGTPLSTAHISLTHAGGSARGIAGIVSGKTLVIGTREIDGAGGFYPTDTNCVDHWIDPDYKQCSGTAALYIFSDQ